MRALELGCIYWAPVDYVQSHDTFQSTRDGRPLSEEDRRALQESEYDVLRMGKFRPVLVIGHDPDTDRVLVVPLYSKRERGLLQQHYERQREEKEKGNRTFATILSIPKVEVKPRKVAGVMESGLLGNSMARLDEMRSLPPSDLRDCLGAVDAPRYRLVLAGYIYAAYGPRMEEAIRSFRAM